MQKTATVLRQIYRRENAHQCMRDKQEIPDAKDQDTALLFRFVYKHRNKPGVHLNELHVGESIFKAEEEILEGWKKYFSELATELSNPLFNDKDRDFVHQELLDIIDICESTSDLYDTVIEAMLWVLSKCKVPAIYAMNTEHRVLASDALMSVLTSLLNSIFIFGDLPE